jgi:hypothetical protein
LRNAIAALENADFYFLDTARRKKHSLRSTRKFICGKGRRQHFLPARFSIPIVKRIMEETFSLMQPIRFA